MPSSNFISGKENFESGDTLFNRGNFLAGITLQHQIKKRKK
jgi:hypothetical protein